MKPILRVLAVVLLLASCDNIKLPTGGGGGTPTRAIKYTALGASDAVGVGAFPPSDGYVFEIGRRLATVRNPVTLKNFGINGAQIDEFLSKELEPAVASAPDLITIWTGSNDLIAGRTVEGFGLDLDRLIGELNRRTTATIFIADLADLTQSPLFITIPDPDVSRERIDAFNAAIVDVAGRHRAILVRLSTGLVLDPEVFSIDGFHPSNEGHRRIADLYWAQIQPRL